LLAIIGITHVSIRSTIRLGKGSSIMNHHNQVGLAVVWYGKQWPDTLTQFTKENRSTISPVTGKSLKLGTQDSSSSRLSMHSHNDIDLLGTGMEYRHPSSTNENSYNNGSASSASGMAVGGLVRSSNDQYADHYSQMPSGAPPDQGYDNGSFSANQHVAYPQVGLPPLLKTRSKSDDFHQGNGEMNDNNGSLLGKSSTLRSPYMPLPLAPASPNSLKNENHSIGSAPPYDQSLPPMVGSQQTEYYLLGGVSNMQSSKDGHGYENRGSGRVVYIRWLQ
jgi:hypothetical protein